MVVASAVAFAGPPPAHAHRARLFASLAQPVSFATTSVTVQGQTVPVAVWCPQSLLPDAWQTAAAYEYDIDIGRIASKLEVDWLSWLPARRVELDRAAVPPDPSFEAADLRPGSDALIFAHGFLGSPFDMAHACEALASDGFLVAAPECPESLSASYEARDGLTREAIVAATQRAVDECMVTAGSDGAPRQWGIFGHSAGSATAILQPGPFALGRACIATSLGRCLESATPDPLFVVASEGDGCNEKMRERGATSPSQALRLARVNRSPPFTEFEGARGAYAQARAGPPPRRGVLLFRRGRDAPLPNHISFLWSGTNEALFELLAPLLPLARALNLFVLDFDAEKEARLAEPTAAELVPAVRRFFGGWRAARAGERP